MKRFAMSILIVLLLGLVMVACGGGGGGTTKGPAEGHYVGELKSTEVDRSLADMRVFTVEFDIDGNNDIVGGKITHVPSGEVIAESGLITGDVRASVSQMNYIIIRLTKVPGGLIHKIDHINLNAASTDGTAFDRSDPSLIKCKLAGQEFGPITDYNFEPAGFRYVSYSLTISKVF